VNLGIAIESAHRKLHPFGVGPVGKVFTHNGDARHIELRLQNSKYSPTFVQDGTFNQMTERNKNLLDVILVCLLLQLASFPALSQQSSCTLPAPPFQIKKPNIFSEQQEQWLGDAQAAQLEPEYTLLSENGTTELTRIGNKLLAQLPPTSIKFMFRVYNDEEVNAFSIAGGHVYVSRKLISDAHNEDEVAGVLAHEIGHIYSHAMTVSETRELKTLLKVTSLSDRHDVEDKQQLLINAPWQPAGAESEDDAENAELIADSIGLFAMTRAGYAPASFAENLERVTDSKGHTSLFLQILAGESTETARRLHAAHKLVNALPAECKSKRPATSPSFTEFQQKLRAESPHWLLEPTAGLASFALEPPMHPELDWIRFSPDGGYILAQDESKVHVLSRTPLKLLFSIEAEGAERARFSPDSKHISFVYPDMRTESWDIASQRRESVHDLVDYRGCLVSSLSPDGKTFACMKEQDQGVGLSLLDVDSGKVFYEKKRFNEFPGYGNRAEIVYSPDGKTMLDLVDERSFAFDLIGRKPIGLHGHLSNLLATRAVFAGNNKLAFQCGDSQTDKDGAILYFMCLDSFPEGEKLGKFPIGDQWVRSITQGDQVLMGPARENAALLIDPTTGNIQRAFRLPQIDLYGQALVSETARGGVALKESPAAPLQAIDLPISPLPPVAAGDFSSDGRYLAYSQSSRGSIWDLTKHTQVSLVRPFSGLRFDDKNHLQLHLITSFQKPGANLTLDPETNAQAPLASFQEGQMLIAGVLVYFKPLDKGYNGAVWNYEMQVSDLATGKLLWTRHFPKGKPGLYESDQGSLIITYNLRTDEADAEISHHRDKVVKSSDTMKEWIGNGLAIEFVDAHTGEIQHILQTPTRPAFRDDDRWVAAFGDYVAVHGNLNNTVVYRLSDGTRTCAFYGRVRGGDGAQGLLAVNNRDQEIIVYDASNGEELLHVALDHLPRVARFVAGTRSLLVLTATQRVYTIPLPTSVRTVTATK
jgi:predicted hotdog family 3-hydroxylacyl-ACP dehydratase